MLSASRCAIAHASASPSNVDVPRPISSISTRLCGVARLQDVRRLGHLDHERRASAGEVVGGADARVDRVERAERRRVAPARTSRSRRAARSTAVCRMYVDLPPMFGPVTMSRRRSRCERRRRSAMKCSTCRSTTGCRPPRMRDARLGDELGRARSSASRARRASASTSSVRERRRHALQRGDGGREIAPSSARRAAFRARARAPAPTAPCPRTP